MARVWLARRGRLRHNETWCETTHVKMHAKVSCLPHLIVLAWMMLPVPVFS
ncbi:hypothetical protein ABIB17_003744, partial [Arthrobacter sp. UYEF6]